MLGLAAVVAAGAAAGPLASVAAAEDAIAITSFAPQRVVAFDTDAPGVLTSSAAVRGLQRKELLTGIDYRARTGVVYAQGSTGRTYVLDPTTGQVDQVGTTPTGGGFFGVDFNPVPDRLRTVSTGEQNLRTNVDTSTTTADTPLNYATGDRFAGQDPEISAAAYTNNVDRATSTSLYVIDTKRNTLALQAPPNDGRLSTVGDLGGDFVAESGFDVSGETGTAFAALTRSTPRRAELFRVNLTTGAATSAGRIGASDGRYRGLTIVPRAEVDVLFNNDPESMLLRSAPSGPAASYGGAARHVELFERLEREAVTRPRTGVRSVIKLNAGDNFLAGIPFQASRERRFPTGLSPYDSIVLDRIGFDGLAIGNHEFDFGPDVFRRFLEGFTDGTKFVSANLDVSDEPSLAPLAADGTIVPSVVVDRGGQRFGIVGATTEDLPFITSPGKATVSAVRPAVQAEIDRIKRLGVNRIILTSQLQGITNDQALASQLSGVDILISGGGQETQADPTTPLVPGDRRDERFQFPIETTNADGDPVRIVTTNGNYKYVGRLVARFDAGGRILNHDESLSQPYRVSGNSADPDFVAEDAFIRERVTNPVLDFEGDLGSQILGTSQVSLEGRRATLRTAETNLGNLTADSLVFEGRRQAQAAGDPLPTIGLQNAGGIRNDNLIPAGPFSRATAFSILPFSNFVATVQLSPARLKDLLEVTVGRIPVADGRFPQVSGFRFTFDPSRTAANPATRPTGGQRIRSLTLDDGTVVIEDGAVAAAAPDSLTLASIDFSLEGGDQYNVADLPRNRYDVTYEEALERFITTPTEQGGLARDGADITAAEYPEGGEGRITRTPAP